MTRQILREAITERLAALGYHVYDASATGNIQVSELPACVISSIQVSSSTGRREQVLKYKVTLIFSQPGSFSVAPQDTLAKLERHIQEFQKGISQDASLHGILNFKTAPSYPPVTKHAEISAKAEFEALLFAVIE